MKRKPPRKALVAASALAIAAVLFRAPIAAALVARGDELLAAAEPRGALSAYRRALTLDPGSGVAADRLAFWLLDVPDRGNALRALAVVDAAIAHGARSAELYADRGLAAARLRRWDAAEADLRHAALLARDPRYAHLSARMAERAGDRARVRSDLAIALELDPRYAPSRALLRAVR